MFKDKKKNKIEYINCDGEVFYDPETKQFAKCFSSKQQELLLWGIQHGYPMGQVAYPDVSPACMREIMKYMGRNEGHGEWNSNIVGSFYWKVAVVFTDPKVCSDVLWAKTNRVDIFNYFDDVRNLTADQIAFIASASTYYINVCKSIRKGLTLEEAEKEARKTHFILGLIYGPRNFLYRLRHPNSEVTRLMKLQKRESAKKIDFYNRFVHGKPEEKDK